MQSGQFPNVGILLSKKEWNSEGVDVSRKTIGKYDKHGKPSQINNWNSDKADSIPDCGCNEVIRSYSGIGYTECKPTTGDGVQGF